MKTLFKLTVVIIGVSAISMPVFAGLETALQRVGDSINAKQSFDGLKKGLDIGNIYAQAYTLAQKEFYGTTAQAVIDMTKDLNMKYGCDLELSDSANILLTIDNASSDIVAMASAVREQIAASDQTNFLNSCVKLIRCATNENTGNPGLRGGANFYDPNKVSNNLYMQEKGSKQLELSNDGYANCKRFAQQAYERNVSSVSTTTSLASVNVGTDIYYNGTLEDSSYDLLVDIQRIGDIMFTNNEQTEKTLFYTFPNNSVAGFQFVPFDAASTQTALPNATVIGANGRLTTPASLATPSAVIPGGRAGASNAALDSATPVRGAPIATSDVGGNVVTTPTYVDTTNTATEGGVIDNFSCLPPDTGGGGDTGGGTGPTDNGGDTGPTDTQGGGQGGTTPSGEPLPPVFDVNTPYYSPLAASNNDPLVDNTSRESPEDYEQQAASIKSCTQKCDGLKAIDKAMCVSKCMCGTTYTKNGMFGLSICTVPTKQTDIVSSKSVQSIEEIVTEINNVLNKLKNSGEMMKHTKTKEFLDTSMAKIKLNQIFAFEVNLSFKPILDSKPRPKGDAAIETQTDNLLKGNYGNIDIGPEKNKYARLRLASVEDAKNSASASSMEDLQSLIDEETKKYNERYSTIKADLTQSIVKSQNAEVADIIKQFLDENTRFRSYINETIGNIQTTADQFKQKIEKGSKSG